MGQDSPRAGGGMELQKGWANSPAGACWGSPVGAEPWLCPFGTLYLMICMHRAASELSASFQINCCSFLNAQCPDLVLTLQEKQGLVGFSSLCQSFPAWEMLLFLFLSFPRTSLCDVRTALWMSEVWIDAGVLGAGQTPGAQGMSWSPGTVREGQWHCRCRKQRGKEGQLCKDAVTRREAGFVFKSEDLCFVSRELYFCLAFCVLFKQFWRLKPLCAPGTGSLKAAPAAAGSKAACGLLCPLLASSSPASPVQLLIWNQKSHC